MTLNITTIMRIKNIFMATLLGVMLHSCEFLDVVPDDTSTLDDAFKTETNAGNFIYGCYIVALSDNRTILKSNAENRSFRE